MWGARHSVFIFKLKYICIGLQAAHVKTPITRHAVGDHPLRLKNIGVCICLHEACFCSPKTGRQSLGILFWYGDNWASLSNSRVTLVSWRHITSASSVLNKSTKFTFDALMPLMFQVRIFILKSIAEESGTSVSSLRSPCSFLLRHARYFMRTTCNFERDWLRSLSLGLLRARGWHDSPWVLTMLWKKNAEGLDSGRGILLTGGPRILQGLKPDRDSRNASTGVTNLNSAWWVFRINPNMCSCAWNS